MKNLMGEGVEKDWENAIKWFRESAKAGNVIAQTNLASVLLMSIDDKLKEEAVKILNMAINKNDYHACVLLGDCYMNGEGVENLLHRAAGLANQNRLMGTNVGKCIGTIFNTLGILYHDKDNKMAEYLYKKAISRGNVKAQMNLEELRKEN